MLCIPKAYPNKKIENTVGNGKAVAKLFNTKG